MTSMYVTVEVDSGKLRGLQSDGVLRFRGIPYAAPTDGRNRFLAPQPVAPWVGVRDALRCGDRCVQERETFADTPVLAWYGQTEPFSEDCCVLNVFTPALDAARRPVMVYIHGGGYVTGGGGGAVLDGGCLAKFGDVVVVTVNHRLNVFGYFNLGHIDPQRYGDAANAGQLDLVSALQWVKRNIEAFGGDPGRVTLFGQSGGGSKITVLMGMPAAQGLFHRAINMSGVSGMNVSPASGTEPYVDAILQSTGIERHQLHKLHEVSAQTLLHARDLAVAGHGEGGRPVVDGRHIPAGAMTPQGLPVHATVPLLMGTVDSEATFYFRTDMRNFHVTARQVRARICAQFGVDDAQARSIMDAYREESPQRTAADVLVALVTDTMFRVPMLRAVEAKADAQGAPVYLYNFCWKSPVDGGVWGAPHTIDIPFAFGNTALSTALTGSGPEPADVSRNLMTAFVAFARTGHPGNSRMPVWRPYDTSSRSTMVIDLECRTVDDFRGADRRAAAALRMDPFNSSALTDYRD